MTKSYNQILAEMQATDLAAKRRAYFTQTHGSPSWKPGVGPRGPIVGHVQKGRIQFKKGATCFPREEIRLAGAWHAAKAFLGTNTVKR